MEEENKGWDLYCEKQKDYVLKGEENIEIYTSSEPTYCVRKYLNIKLVSE